MWRASRGCALLNYLLALREDKVGPEVSIPREPGARFFGVPASWWEGSEGVERRGRHDAASCARQATYFLN
jgi:hypothetical protein